MKITTFTENLDTPVTVTSYRDGSFKVVYGEETARPDTYGDMCRVLGECLVHSMVCAGTFGE